MEEVHFFSRILSERFLEYDDPFIKSKNLHCFFPKKKMVSSLLDEGICTQRHITFLQLSKCLVLKCSIDTQFSQ